MSPAAASQAAPRTSTDTIHWRPEDNPPSSRHMLVGKEMASLLTTYSVKRRLTKLPSCPGACNKTHQTQMAFLRLPQTHCMEHVSVLWAYCPSHSSQAREPCNHISAYPGDRETRKVENHQIGTCSLFPDSCPTPGLKDKLLTKSLLTVPFPDSHLTPCPEWRANEVEEEGN